MTKDRKLIFHITIPENLIWNRFLDIMSMEMSIRLIVAIISIALEEGAIAAIVLLALPRFNINVPVAGLTALMVLWLIISIVIYRVGSRALRTRPVISLPDMIGAAWATKTLC